MTESTTRVFGELSPHYRALVICALMLDGIDAALFLGTDELLGPVLQEAVNELLNYPLELRMPLMGTLFREALEEMTPSAFSRDL